MTDFVRRYRHWDEAWIRANLGISPGTLIADADWEDGDLVLNLFIPIEEA